MVVVPALSVPPQLMVTAPAMEPVPPKLAPVCTVVVPVPLCSEAFGATDSPQRHKAQQQQDVQGTVEAFGQA
ncbi:MAG: hypothetical protein JZU64_07980 [Rhodoferax sp.]|nr:hypothetical protein [Rhodoferax sp.]